MHVRVCTVGLTATFAVLYTPYIIEAIFVSKVSRPEVAVNRRLCSSLAVIVSTHWCVPRRLVGALGKPRSCVRLLVYTNSSAVARLRSLQLQDLDARRASVVRDSFMMTASARSLLHWCALVHLGNTDTIQLSRQCHRLADAAVFGEHAA